MHQILDQVAQVVGGGQNRPDGPRGRTAETCTHWDIRYTVSGDPEAYRIRKSKATSAPC